MLTFIYVTSSIVIGCIGGVTLYKMADFRTSKRSSWLTYIIGVGTILICAAIIGEVKNQGEIKDTYKLISLAFVLAPFFISIILIKKRKAKK